MFGEGAVFTLAGEGSLSLDLVCGEYFSFVNILLDLLKRGARYYKKETHNPKLN